MVAGIEHDVARVAVESDPQAAAAAQDLHARGVGNVEQGFGSRDRSRWAAVFMTVLSCVVGLNILSTFRATNGEFEFSMRSRNVKSLPSSTVAVASDRGAAAAASALHLRGRAR
jgi:hypothetical protein